MSGKNKVGHFFAIIMKAMVRAPVGETHSNLK